MINYFFIAFVVAFLLLFFISGVFRINKLAIELIKSSDALLFLNTMNWAFFIMVLLLGVLSFTSFSVVFPELKHSFGSFPLLETKQTMLLGIFMVKFSVIFLVVLFFEAQKFLDPNTKKPLMKKIFKVESLSFLSVVSVETGCFLFSPDLTKALLTMLSILFILLFQKRMRILISFLE